MIRISQLKLSVNHSEEDLKKKAAKMLKLQPADIRRITVIKQSVDARKKSSEVLFIYTVDVETAREDKVLHCESRKEGIPVSEAGNGTFKTPSRHHRKRAGRPFLRAYAGESWVCSPYFRARGEGR